MLTALKRTVTSYTTLAAKIYRDLGGTADQLTRSLSTTVDNRVRRTNPVQLEHLFADLQAYGWKDAVPNQATLERVAWTIPMKGWAASFSFDEIDVGRPDTVAKVEDLVRLLPGAFIEKRVELHALVFETNPLAYDGANLFSNAHQHPNGRGVFSNVVNVDVSTGASDEEILEVVKDIHLKLRSNTALRRTWTLHAAADMEFTLAVPGIEWLKRFETVRDQATILDANNKTITNPMQGKFQVVENPDTTSSFFYASWNGPGNVRPLVHVPDQDPRLFIEEPGQTTRGEVHIGMKGIFAVKPLFYQAALRWQFTGNG